MVRVDDDIKILKFLSNRNGITTKFRNISDSLKWGDLKVQTWNERDKTNFYYNMKLWI